MKVQQIEFEPPTGYNWMLNSGLLDLSKEDIYNPWEFLEKDLLYEVDPSSNQTKYISFAFCHKDSGTACFEILLGKVIGIQVFHDVGENLSIGARYLNFWDWLHSMISDIREWHEN